ncbi:grasp-with-spasm system ATP-grasp peptide maturase [Flavobacterium supellecticarium]|uniref:Grasp-with-spasm system ATP-grasp peptide maturase n=1 Tax=Flavobacterium supellecticarium TaxID=2565924 RepID=A0A4S4A0G5_9FLAO|nr:grasp-with-spasm system ATP-grasp peptide maturase [Flavobacterium supellecticarium]THF51794.1 grasp-with-spasm system ATP-grasp peptide maturase [Flavobacterium supellecticarium]
MKEIFIQSERNDLSTDDVIAWIYYLKKDIKINTFLDDYLIDSLSIEMSNNKKVEVRINNKKLNSISNVWYRRGEWIGFDKNNVRNKEIHRKINTEAITPALEFLNSGFSINQINKFDDNQANKLKMLRTALSLGIKIPDVLLTGSNLELHQFIKKHKKVITKPVENPYTNFKFKNHSIKFSTSSKLITEDDVEENESFFLPSFFQKYIEKKYEIRSFYIDGLFKSMAIFSQQNEKTKIDFRNYDRIRPNRCVPYLLPKALERKLHKLMIQMELNCGSFDIIVTPQNQYYFLEVNPIGQFQWVSLNCNYYIEKLIAKRLTKNGNQSDTKSC